ncbi:MAG TPA: hypothetical protein VI039_07445 [Solirubrobacterales bacterium]
MAFFLPRQPPSPLLLFHGVQGLHLPLHPGQHAAKDVGWSCQLDQFAFGLAPTEVIAD